MWSWWRAPLNRSSGAGRWFTVALLTLFTALGSVLPEHSAGNPFLLADVAYYVRIAQGRMTEVQQPFASRPLAPLVARGLARATHVPIETGFEILGMVSLLFLLTVVFALATEAGAPRWCAFAMATVPFWPQLWQGYPLPDLPYAALLCGLLLLLRRRWYTAAALWLLPLTLARESTMLLLLCLLLVGWRHLRPWRCGLACVAAVVGSIAVKHLTAGAADNQEHLPAWLYLAGKVPWNLVRTLGVNPWSNLYPYLCPVPTLRMHVGVGSLQAVGICSFSPAAPGLAAAALLTSFGLLPLFLVMALAAGRSGMTRAWDRLNLVPRFCLVYGGVSFLLAPALGTAHARLFGYGWPVFLVTLPVLLAGGQGAEGKSTNLSGDRILGSSVAGVLGLAHVLLLYLAFQLWSPAVFAVEAGLWALSLVLWRVQARMTRTPVSGPV